MRSKAPALLPIFRSQVQGEILALLLGDLDREWSVTEVADATGAPLTTVQSELTRLEDSDLLASRKFGRNRLMRANIDHPLMPPLTHIVLRAFGPIPRLAEVFAPLGAAYVIIFGSWAARIHGDVGPFPADLDVLVVADGIDREDLYRAAERVEASTGAPVNPVLRSTRAWRNPAKDPLLAEIHSRPMVTVLRG